MFAAIPKSWTLGKIKDGLGMGEGLCQVASGTYIKQTGEFTSGSFGLKSWALRLYLVLDLGLFHALVSPTKLQKRPYTKDRSV